MTHITIYKSSDTKRNVGFMSAGHSGYADEGSDIICSAISLLTFNTVNSVEKFTDDKFEVSVNEDEASLYFLVTSEISEKTQVLLDALELGLVTLAKGNPDYLLIIVKEV
ncbi:MAG: ribosomal-processing cysteine protease Prp [Eubacteriales bacterium]|nr:ribosomal-processing cysteine protease Prp [Eubacteriales bacterium]